MMLTLRAWLPGKTEKHGVPGVQNGFQIQLSPEPAQLGKLPGDASRRAGSALLIGWEFPSGHEGARQVSS